MAKEATSGLRLFGGAVAVITGGASGIGAALGRALAAQGAHVVLADRQGDTAQSQAERIGSTGGSAQAAALDVRDAAAFDALIARVHDEHGRLDLIFNNAGIGCAGQASGFSLEDWRDAVEVNLMGVIHGVRAAYPLMVRQGFGHIVNTASMAGLIPTPHFVPYGTTKHAVVGLGRGLRSEGAVHGVRVSTLCPGFIRTDILVDGGRYGRNTARIPAAEQLRLVEPFRPMDVDEFARRALPCIRRNEPIIIFPRMWRVLDLLQRVAPSVGDLLGRTSARWLMAQLGVAAPSGSR